MHPPRDAVLQRLATNIVDTGLKTPALITLDLLIPVAFITSQLTLVVRPFAHAFGWEAYINALADETSWQRLRELLIVTPK